ncbi:MAG: hypothetical protein JXX14_16540 [Deltaproteobacteria bacterium]|nr:hypothetical protein [Deltaproteobacteria bacterium]
MSVDQQYVRITVRDSGPGITAAHLDKVFDPFFTTREPGRGLGLSTCYSILQRHDGGISVKSTPGEGTQVDMYLPAILQKQIPKVTGSGPGQVKSGRILIMDDDEVVRIATAAILRRFGYDVTETADGESAFEVFRACFNTPNAFQAVLLDLTIHGGWGGAPRLWPISGASIPPHRCLLQADTRPSRLWRIRASMASPPVCTSPIKATSFVNYSMSI